MDANFPRQRHYRLVQRFPTHPTVLFRLSILAIGHALLGNVDRALELGREAYERKPSIWLHAIAYAAAASGRDAVTGTAAFAKLVATHELGVGDAGRFPFADGAGQGKLEDFLQGAGLPG